MGASDEDLIKKTDEDSDKKTSFFDNTIDESENESIKSMKMDHGIKMDGTMKMDEVMKNPEMEMPGHSEKPKNVFTNEISFMEIENKREKKRWLYMSELGGIFGEDKHTREGFIKIFGNRVSCGEQQVDE